jgi:hypothetical protein
MPRFESNRCLESNAPEASTRGPQRPEIVEINASNGAYKKPPIAPNGSLVYLSNEVSSCGALMPRFESNRCLESNAPEASTRGPQRPEIVEINASNCAQWISRLPQQ